MDIEILTIKELLASGVQKIELIEICNDLYEMTDFICEDYPKHKSWFFQKHLKETLSDKSSRDIIFARNKENINLGVAFIKKDEKEKKICTLYVKENARGLGVATKLVEKSMEILGTTKPMITLADYKLPMFEGLIKKYGWEKSQEVSGLYNERSIELVYNGKLVDDNNNEDERQQ